ncbi:MAG: LysM peptidoglycan-binding domain-containing protein, partial [bacterium]|nr:LysM peptidoglycan-binding domain-containing protein [bacterium]
MRTDVKIGLTLSLVVVIVAGWYYLRRSAREEAIPLAVELASSNLQAQDDADVSTPDSAVPVGTKPPAESTEQPAVPDEEPDTGLEGMLARGDDERSTGGGEDPLRNLIERGRGTAGPVAAGDTDAPAPADEAVAADVEDQAEAEPEAPVSGNTQSGPPQAIRAGRTGVRRPSGNNDSAAQASQVRTRASKAARSSRGRSADLPGTRRHVVGGGDSFAILAEVYYGSQKHTGFLIAANPHVADPQRLVVGTVLKIPPLGSTRRATDSAERTARQRRPSRPAARPAQAKATPQLAKGTYTVKSGDSFYSIAKEVLADANRWPELLALNKDLVDGDPPRPRPAQVGCATRRHSGLMTAATASVADPQRLVVGTVLK